MIGQYKNRTHQEFEDFNKMMEIIISDYKYLMNANKMLNINMNSTVVIFSTLIDILISKKILTDEELKAASKDAFDKIEEQNRKMQKNDTKKYDDVFIQQLLNSEDCGHC